MILRICILHHTPPSFFRFSHYLYLLSLLTLLFRFDIVRILSPFVIFASSSSICSTRFDDYADFCIGLVLSIFPFLLLDTLLSHTCATRRLLEAWKAKQNSKFFLLFFFASSKQTTTLLRKTTYPTVTSLVELEFEDIPF